MSEIVRRVSGEIVPRATGQLSGAGLNDVVRGGWPIERMRLGKELRRQVFDEQLAALRTSLRIGNHERLTRQRAEAAVRLGEEIMRALISTDNPLVEMALRAVMDTWIRQSNQILAGYSY